MLSGKPLSDGVVGHTMLLPKSGSLFDRNISSYYHSTVKLAGRLRHRDWKWGIEEYQPRSHPILRLSCGVVGSPRSRTLGDQTFRCKCEVEYQAGGGCRRQYPEDRKNTRDWPHTHQLEIVLGDLYCLIVASRFGILVLPFFCWETTDCCRWDSETGGTINDCSSSLEVWPLWYALYLIPVRLACSMWSAIHEVRIGQQQGILPSGQGHRPPELMSPLLGSRLTGSISNLTTLHSSGWYISL